MTKAFTAVILLVASLAVSACWEDKKPERVEGRGAEFMKDFSKCSDCDKPWDPFGSQKGR